MERIVITGTTGSGKTFLAEQLGQRLGMTVIDLDALHWGPNWTPASDEEFRQRVADGVAGERWVIGGNYLKARDLVWTRADTLIWLDYPLRVVMWRLLRRTLKRVITRENLWGTGNRETWRSSFFSADSVFLWALKAHPRHRRDYPHLLQQPAFAHLRVLRMRSPEETARWLETVGTAETQQA